MRLPDYHVLHFRNDHKIVLEDVQGEQSEPHGKSSISDGPDFDELEIEDCQYPADTPTTSFTLYRVHMTDTWITNQEEKEKFIVCKFW